MPAPFPGMNPYLEHPDPWHDFHQTFIPAAREWIRPQVEPRYIVKVEQHLYIHELDAESRRLVGKADVSVARPAQAGETSGSTAILEAPTEVTLPLAVDIEHESFLEIQDRESREVITAIELLSPINKRPGPDREQYLTKRRELLRSDANLVEIDLLRAWPRMPVLDPPPCDYWVLVSRPQDRPRAGIWPISLRDRLPPIPIPLRPNEPAATLDLQQVFERVFVAGGYGSYIYAHSPEPPLSPEDAEWATQFVPAKN